ncbi:UNVERIFIED_CONTAM: hypothetical protein GTU68_057269 [Idotea baltica]|nr:hypothetical protein [Idotea baltica]
MSDKGFRNVREKLKNARGRKNSSQLWLRRHINDPFVQMAKKDGYRSRAAYKLTEIEEKFKLIKNAKSVVDLGCAPGGWLQVVKRLSDNKDIEICGVDLLDITPVKGVSFIQGDFTTQEVHNELEALIKGKADLVISDMAANATGNKDVDHLKNMHLIELAIEFCQGNLHKNGAFVAKALRGQQEEPIRKKMKEVFEDVFQFKPKASYAGSTEVYYVCKTLKKD